MDSFALSFLLLINSVLGISDFPKADPNWEITKNWSQDPASGLWISQAESTKIPDSCRKNPNGYLITPMIIQGGYEIQVDNKIVTKFGNIDRSRSTGYYGIPELHCEDVMDGKKITVNFYSYLKYYARVNFYPYVAENDSINNLLSRSLGFAIGICLLLFSLFSLFFFSNKVDRELSFSLFLANFFLAIYQIFSVIEFIPIRISDSFVHKYGLSCLWIGIGFLIKCLDLEKLTIKHMKRTYYAMAFVGISIKILFFQPDTVQLGTHIVFLPTLVLFAFSLVKLIKRKDKLSNRILMFRIISIFLLVIFALNDVFMVVGLTNTPPLFSMGILCCLFFFMMSINQQIAETYKERDYLQKNLELEVERKTNELKIAQAELVQSAKLASLGTLAAGIAHEINNSVNYVNGALVPLEKILNQNVKDEEQKIKVNKLFTVMKDGVHLTVDIIRSLRNYTGLNQAQVNDLVIYEIVESSLTILRDKTRNKIEVKNEIDKSLKIYGSVTGLNQIFMNLISNAIDAMPNGGTLTFKNKMENETIIVTIQDTGKGIAPENISRIFDPFFTTKEIGKGTGLGLHIVMSEIQKCNGSIDVTSDVGRGTTFTLKFPISKKDESKGKAA